MFGSPAFVLGGTADSATLWLPRNERVLTARADEIVEALIGLRLGPRALLAVLVGVRRRRRRDHREREVRSARRHHDRRRPSVSRTARQAVADHRGLTAGLIVEYSDIRGDWPRALRITTEAGHTPAVSLSMTIDQIDVNLPRDAKEFVVKVAATAAPMTLDDLRAAGPLREKK